MYSRLSLLLLCVLSETYKISGEKYPVILVPGDGGSQLEVKLNKTWVPHYLCRSHTSTYDNIWLNLEELLPTVIDCFVDNMRLRYDPKARTTSNCPGVDFRISGFGNTSTVEWLDPDSATHFSSKFSYFYPIVEELVALGYKRGFSVRGAPFDFRKAPNELGGFYNKLKLLVEDTYRLNNNTKVVFVAHSYGNPITLYFLNHVETAWKDKYIHAFVTLAGVWGGAVKPLRLMSSGDSLGVIIVNPLKVRPEQRSMPSTAFLMPSDQFWNSSEVLVYTKHKNYTVSDYHEFFNDMNFTYGYEMRKDTAGLIHALKPPQVPVHCLHGYDVDTPQAFDFRKGTFPDTYPITVPGDGDGTVNIRSLMGCLRWRKQQKQPVKYLKIAKAEHMAILSDDTVKQYVIDVATGKL